MKGDEIAIQFRMKVNTHKKLKVISSAEHRSLNSQIEYFVLKGIQGYERRNGEILINKESKEINKEK